MMIRQCQAVQGRRSMRAGMRVETVSADAARALMAPVLPDAPSAQTSVFAA
jgi:hypothetical protein